MVRMCSANWCRSVLMSAAVCGVVACSRVCSWSSMMDLRVVLQVAPKVSSSMSWASFFVSVHEGRGEAVKSLKRWCAGRRGRGTHHRRIRNCWVRFSQLRLSYQRAMSKRVNRSCQQIDRLETLRIECRSLGKTESEMWSVPDGEKWENSDQEKIEKIWIPIGWQ